MRKRKKIGRVPIPKLTCRFCFEQVSMVDEYALEIHVQLQHPEEYERTLQELWQLAKTDTTTSVS